MPSEKRMHSVSGRYDDSYVPEASGRHLVFSDSDSFSQQTFYIGPLSGRYRIPYRSAVGIDIGPLSDVQHGSTSARHGQSDIQPAFSRQCADMIIRPDMGNRYSADDQPALCQHCADIIYCRGGSGEWWWGWGVTRRN